MALFRFLFAPALLAAAVLAGHGERRRSPPPAPAAVHAPQRAQIGPAVPSGPAGDRPGPRSPAPR